MEDRAKTATLMGVAVFVVLVENCAGLGLRG
jgi:hypothetical protein